MSVYCALFYLVYWMTSSVALNIHWDRNEDHIWIFLITFVPITNEEEM